MLFPQRKKQAETKKIIDKTLKELQTTTQTLKQDEINKPSSNKEVLA